LRLIFGAMLEKILFDELTRFESIVFVFLIPACVLGIFSWKKLSTAYRWLVAFVCFDLCIELGARLWIWAEISDNNLPLLHLCTLGELTIWMFFFRELTKSRQIQRFQQYAWLGLVALVVANTVFLQPLDTFNSYSKTLVQLIIMVLCLQYEFKFVDTEEIAEKKDKSFQWVNRATLLYYGGSMFVFMFSEYAPAAWNQGYNWLWNFNVLLNVFLHFNILIAIWKTAKTYPTSSIWQQQGSH
jgi:hypothetical protein